MPNRHSICYSFFPIIFHHSKGKTYKKITFLLPGFHYIIRDEDKIDLEHKVFFNIEKTIKPYLDKLKATKLDNMQQSYLAILESNIDDIISPLTRKLAYKFKNMTASEIQVANLVIEGKRTKEIAALLSVSDKTIEVHRKNIRKKLGLRNRKADLRSHLLSIRTARSGCKLGAIGKDAKERSHKETL